MVEPRHSVAYVRQQEAPRLPYPGQMSGLWQHLRTNYFSSFGSGVVTLVLGIMVASLAWKVFGFAVIDAAWSGDNRDACLATDGQIAGACWPFVEEKFAQWIYGFYPIEERWRINLCFASFATGLIPMLVPSAPLKLLNLTYLLTIFPLLTFILLTGGNLDFSPASYIRVLSLVFFGTALLPSFVFGFEEGTRRNNIGLAFAGATVVVWGATFLSPRQFEVAGLDVIVAALSIAAGAVSLWAILKDREGRLSILARVWCGSIVLLLVSMCLVDFDFGLTPVETSQWGGLTVTLIVSVTGIAASLPLGILLALGRQSRMQVLRVTSVVFIEFVRGVPLITVLFMASVMLPLFLPAGMNFDKLLRALVGVALFSAAYMAEVVRGGLQAVPKGQYEGATALGLSYWQMMTRIILPQALKISIPNIVSNFIALFKDTTLVLIIGLFDLLAIAQTGLRDAAWASPVTAPTGYLVVALVYWVFCFGMSRYAAFTERRLRIGYQK